MVQFKVNRGNESDLPILLTDGWVYFCTDTGNVYFDWQDGENVRRTQMNAKYADIIRYHDGSDYIDIDPAEIALKNDIPKIDNTLTADGQAADAKTVGDELNKKISAPSTASVGQALRVKTVDENGMPTEWETADVSETGTASIDPTLTKEGFAADAKAVGEALEKKANKTLRVTVDWVDATSSYTSSHSLQEILEHWNNGDDVVCEYGTRVFGLTSINEYAAVFAYKTVSETCVKTEWFSIDSNSAVQHDYRTYDNKVDQARTKDDQNPQVGQAVTVKELDRYGHISAYETVDLPKSATVDKTLSIEGASADAKVVGEELGKKAPKRLIINLSSTGVINTYQADKTLEEVRECYQNGSEVVIEHYSGRYECTAVYDTNAYFFTAADVSDTMVRKIRAVMDVNGIVTTSYNDYVNKVDTARTKDDGIPRVGQVIAVKSVNRYNRIEEYETVDLPSIDATLSVEGQAADAKAVGDALAEKALKTLYVEPTDIAGEGNGQPTLFPVKIANHSVEEIKAWFQNGGNVKLSYWGRVLDLKGCEGACANFESTSYDSTGGGGAQLAIFRATIQPDGSIFVYYPESLGYVRNNFSAKVGQTIVVDAVDEHDIPTAWKAVDMASSTPKEKTLQVTIEFVRGAYIASHSLAQIREYKESGWKITARYMYNTELELEELGDYSARFEKLYMLQYGSDHFELKYEQITINNGDDRSAYYSNYSRNLTAIDFVASGDKRYVTGGAVYDYAVPIPATAEVGQVLSVKAVDDNGKPTEWEPVDMSGGGAVELDATLSVEGAAADAKATGDALAGKANKTLHVELTWDNTNGVDIPSHSSQEIYEYVVNGGDAEVLWNGYIHKIDSYSPTSCIFVNHGIGFNGNTYTYQISSVQIYDGKTVGKSSNNYFAVDSALSETSNNAVRNSVITKALAEKAPNTLFVNGIWDSTAGKAYSDVSYNEILAHYNAGGRVFLTYSGSIMELTEAGKYGANYAVFEKIELDSVGGMLYRRWAFIYDTDEVEWDSRSFNVGTDSELNYYSSNSVQNKVITAALAQKSQVQIITWEDDD